MLAPTGFSIVQYFRNAFFDGETDGALATFENEL